MTHSLSFGQTESTLHKILENKQEIFVKPVRYLVENDDMTNDVESICLSLKEGNFIECKIQLKDKDNADYWSFNVNVKNVLSNINFESDLWLYIDDDATGTYKFHKGTGVETIEILFHIYKDEYRYVIQWKGESKE